MSSNDWTALRAEFPTLAHWNGWTARHVMVRL